MNLTQEQLDAIEAMVNYLMDNEQNSFEEYVAEGGNPSCHIYSSAKLIDVLLHTQTLDGSSDE